MAENHFPKARTAYEPPAWKTQLAMWVLVFIWAANFSVVKYALGDFEPLAFNSLRFVISSFMLWVLWKTQAPDVQFEAGDWPRLVLVGLVGNTMYQVFFIIGIDWTLAGNTSLILGTVPVFVALFSWFFAVEDVGGKGWVGVTLSLAGIGLVVAGSAANVEFGGASVRGDVVILIAALAWSIYTVMSRPLVRKYGALPVTAVTMWFGAAGLVFVSTPSLIQQDWGSVGWPAWVSLMYSSVFSIGVAYLLWNYSVKHVGSTRTAVYSNTIPIVALVIAWVSIGEVPVPLQVAGAVAIVAGVWFTMRG